MLNSRSFRARVLAGASIACAALATLAACTTNPYTGESQFILVDQAQLAQAAEASWNELRQQEPISNDPILNQRARTVANRIVQAAGLTDRSWEVAVFDSDERNAFVLPGGQIGVYRGMIEFSQNDSQLAAVLGHEVGHVVGRHAAERYSQQVGASVGASVLGAAIGGSESAETWQKVFGTGAQLGLILPYSRGNESEADLLGVDYMVRAGYDPDEAVTLWRRMAAEGGARGPVFLSTHPDPNARAAEIERYIAQRGY